MREEGSMARQSRKVPRRPVPQGEPLQPLRIAIKLNHRIGKPPQHLTGLERFLAQAGQAGGGLAIAPLIESLEPQRLGALVDGARRMHGDDGVPDFALGSKPSVQPASTLTSWRVRCV